MIVRLSAILLTLMLAGCGAGQTLTSIQGGESKVFQAPPYVVKGKAPYDQNWIDNQIEGGVAAFGWPRPAPRPPEIDAPSKPNPKKAVVVKKKRTLLGRVKDRIVPPAAASVWPDPGTVRSPVIAAPVQPEPEPTAATPPPARSPSPRDDVDELLNSEPIKSRSRTR